MHAPPRPTLVSSKVSEIECCKGLTVADESEVRIEGNIAGSEVGLGRSAPRVNPGG
jgi:hypothetical protein